MFCGPKFGMMRDRLGPGVLANLLFGSPVVQDFGSSNATHKYLLQESSGNHLDTGTATAAPVDTFSTGYQGQTAVGIRSASSSIAQKAWETSVAASTARVSDATVFDSNNSDLYFRMHFRVGVPLLASKVIMSKRTGAGAGWDVTLTATGGIDIDIEDGSGNTITVTLSGDHADGAPHYLEFFYDDSADELTVNSDLDNGNAATSSATVTGSLTTAAYWTMGDASGAALVQFIECEGAEGIAAATMFAETDWWTHATDPTPGQLLSVQTRGSAISCPVADGYVAHYADDTIPTAWHAGFSDADKLGILTNSPLTNLLWWSEDFTDAVWVKTNCSVVGNDVDSPDGFRSADKMTASAANGYLSQVFATTGATQYTLSYWPQEETVGCSGRLIFYDESSGAELDSQAFVCDGTWEQRIKVTATTNAGQVSSSFRVEIDTNTEELHPWGAQATLGDGASGAYIRTTNGTGTLAASEYTAGSLSPATNAAKGEVRAKFIRTQYVSGTGKIFNSDGTANQNRRYAYCDSPTRIQWRTYDGAGASEDFQFQNASALGTLQDFRHIWDESAGGGITGGYESVMVLNGTTYNGAASPWDGTTGAGADTTDIDIGHDAGVQQMDAIFQSIVSYDDLSEALP